MSQHPENNASAQSAAAARTMRRESCLRERHRSISTSCR
jgi:hypothetical protein